MTAVTSTVVPGSIVWPKIRRLDDDAESVSKLIFTKPDAIVEAVLYRYQSYADRTVICCSVQSGCPIGCRFCGTGDAFVRSLTVEEIIAQPITCLDQVAATGTDPTKIDKLQIMFMSMGEPLMNLPRVVEAIRRLHALYPNAQLLISTSAPKVDLEPLMQVSREIPTVGLQFSVHESTDAGRDALIPFANKMTLVEISQAGQAWASATGRSPFFNFCVHDGNNSDADVERLRALFDPSIWQATLSVICERDEGLLAAHDRQRALTEEFMRKMVNAGFSTRMFDPAGADSIGGGCGQLWHVQNWYASNPDKARRNAGTGLKIVHAPGSIRKENIA